MNKINLNVDSIRIWFEWSIGNLLEGKSLQELERLKVTEYLENISLEKKLILPYIYKTTLTAYTQGIEVIYKCDIDNDCEYILNNQFKEEYPYGDMIISSPQLFFIAFLSDPLKSSISGNKLNLVTKLDKISMELIIDQYNDHVMEFNKTIIKNILEKIQYRINEINKKLFP